MISSSYLLHITLILRMTRHQINEGRSKFARNLDGIISNQVA